MTLSKTRIRLVLAGALIAAPASGLVASRALGGSRSAFWIAVAAVLFLATTLAELLDWVRVGGELRSAARRRAGRETEARRQAAAQARGEAHRRWEARRAEAWRRMSEQRRAEWTREQAAEAAREREERAHRSASAGGARASGASSRSSSGSSQSAGSSSWRSRSAGADEPRRSAARPAPPSPHRVLGVGAAASAREIKAAYRRLVKQYHPDRVCDMPREYREMANAKTREIREAYEALTRA